MFCRVCVLRIGYTFLTKLTEASGTGLDILSNPQKYRMRYGCCTERKNVSGTGVWCCTRTPGTDINLFHNTQKFRVWYLFLQNSQKCRVRECIAYRTHKSIGYGMDVAYNSRKYRVRVLDMLPVPVPAPAGFYNSIRYRYPPDCRGEPADMCAETLSRVAYCTYCRD